MGGVVQTGFVDRKSTFVRTVSLSKTAESKTRCIPSCYGTYFMLPFSVEEQAYITEAFNSISTCLDDLLNSDKWFCKFVDEIYPIEFKLSKADSSDIDALFWI